MTTDVHVQASKRRPPRMARMMGTLKPDIHVVLQAALVCCGEETPQFAKKINRDEYDSA